MKIENFVIGIVGTNCYVVQNEDTRECFLVDPAACPAKLLNYIKEHELKPTAILLTHGHFDHIMGVDDLLKEFQIPVYAHKAEEAMLRDPKMNSSLTYGPGYTFAGAQYVEDCDKIQVAGMELEVLYTPGHTIGGCCYYLQAESTLFCGDTLFRASIGRSDLATGDGDQLICSIQNKLMCLPEDTKVLPGHMGATTIGYEKQYNPFLK